MTLRAFGLLACLLCSTLGGCIRGPIAWQRMSVNFPINPDDVGFIVKGRTTLAEVAERLGAPDELLDLQSGAVATYHFSDGKYFRVDWGWGLRFIVPFYSPEIVQSGGGVGMDAFQVKCDDKWVVQHYAFAFHANSSKFRFWPFGD